MLQEGSKKYDPFDNIEVQDMEIDEDNSPAVTPVTEKAAPEDINTVKSALQEFAKSSASMSSETGKLGIPKDMADLVKMLADRIRQEESAEVAVAKETNEETKVKVVPDVKKTEVAPKKGREDRTVKKQEDNRRQPNQSRDRKQDSSGRPNSQNRDSQNRDRKDSSSRDSQMGSRDSRDKRTSDKGPDKKPADRRDSAKGTGPKSFDRKPREQNKPAVRNAPPAKPAPAKTAPARPAPAQHTPARPSPAQRTPARPAPFQSPRKPPGRFSNGRGLLGPAPKPLLSMPPVRPTGPSTPTRMHGPQGTQRPPRPGFHGPPAMGPPGGPPGMHPGRMQAPDNYGMGGGQEDYGMGGGQEEYVGGYVDESGTWVDSSQGAFEMRGRSVDDIEQAYREMSKEHSQARKSYQDTQHGGPVHHGMPGALRPQGDLGQTMGDPGQQMFPAMMDPTLQEQIAAVSLAFCRIVIVKNFLITVWWYMYLCEFVSP